MVYSLQRDPREPDYRKRLPTAHELERQKPVKIGPAVVPNRLGPRRRQMTLLLTVVGLATFVVPLITSVPAVMGRAQWSPWEMFMGVTGNTLPAAVILTAQGFHDVRWLIFVDSAMLGALFDYAMLAAVLVSAMGHASRRVIGGAGALGVLGALVEMRGSQDFQLAIFGAMPDAVGGQHVRAMTWCVLMLAVMVLLLVVAVYTELDGGLPAKG